jgi:hypothetical protein
MEDNHYINQTPTWNFDIRKSTFAKQGLYDLCFFLEKKYSDLLKLEIAEIGSFCGVSGWIFSQFFKKVNCIDPWKSGYDDKDLASNPDIYSMEEIEKEFDRTAGIQKNVIKLKKSSEEAVKDFPNHSLDFVYIDGLHTYDGCKKDIELWFPKVRPGMAIGGHDYGSKHFPGVKKAVDECFQDVQRFSDSSWVKIV